MAALALGGHAVDGLVAFYAALLGGITAGVIVATAMLLAQPSVKETISTYFSRLARMRWRKR